MEGKGTLLKGFGGKDRWLFYTARGWAAVGEQLGIKVRLGHFQHDLFQAPLDLSCIHVFIWGGLLHAEPALKLEDVSDWVDEDNVTELIKLFFARYGGTSEAVEEGISQAMSQAEETADQPGEEIAAMAGATS